jgi:putative membrane protein
MCYSSIPFFGTGMMGGGFGWFFMVIFWGLIIWGIVYFIQRMGGEHRHSDRSLEILKERFARGEINAEEYEKMKKMLI